MSGLEVWRRVSGVEVVVGSVALLDRPVLGVFSSGSEEFWGHIVEISMSAWSY